MPNASANVSSIRVSPIFTCRLLRLLVGIRVARGRPQVRPIRSAPSSAQSVTRSDSFTTHSLAHPTTTALTLTAHFTHSLAPSITSTSTSRPSRATRTINCSPGFLLSTISNNSSPLCTGLPSAATITSAYSRSTYSRTKGPRRSRTTRKPRKPERSAGPPGPAG